MSKQVTIRGVTPQLAERLEGLARQRGLSVNATVLELLEGALGVSARRERFKRYATWSKDEVDDFDRLLREQRNIDEELWK